MNIKIYKLVCLIVFISTVFTFSKPVYSKSFNTLDVTQTAHSLSCLDYKILPSVCVYLLIIVTPFGVYFKYFFRDRISHKLPDFVVSSFEESGENPWTEIKLAFGAIMRTIQNSTAVTSFFDGKKLVGAGKENKLVVRSAGSTVRNKRFHEVNVVGSPAPSLLRVSFLPFVPVALNPPYICRSGVTPFRPYLMTEADSVAWRKPETELNQSWRIPGAREIGSKSLSNLSGNTWGKAVPRTGYVLQTEPSKAAAVSAVRGVDIVTKSNQIPHIYSSFGTSGVDEVLYVPDPIVGGCGVGRFGELERDQNCATQHSLGAFDQLIEDARGGSNSIRPSIEESCPTTCYSSSSSATKLGSASEKAEAWQMISPQASTSCEAFGSTSLGWPKDKNNEKGEYGWNYWREYECCKPAPGILLNP